MGFLLGITVINNYVLLKLYGLPTFVGSPKNLKSALFLGLSLIFVLISMSILNYPIKTLFDFEYFGLLINIFFILLLLQLEKFTIKNFFPSLYNKIGVFFPVIMFNSVFFALILELFNQKVDFIDTIIYSSASGLSYTIALILLSILRNHIDEESIPEHFRGLPINLICAGIISLLFQIVFGVVETI